MDTIFALASARGRAGVAVIRVSGPLAHDSVRLLCGDVPKARKAVVRKVYHNDLLIDEALVITFDAGASFTGENIAEFQVHGGGAVVQGVLTALTGMAGFRLAEAGEFTRRALENGRLDLAQVEGLADLIDAETEAQRRQAMRILSGAMAEKVAYWRGELLRAMALLEATIDFSEEDLPAGLVQEVAAAVSAVLDDLRRQLDGQHAAERLREGFEVALVGPPNAGKSTLLNALARRDAALTSPIAGTTRDVIEVRMDVQGLPITILDTAGLRITDDPLELAGIDRTRTRADAADMRIFMVMDQTDGILVQPQAGDIFVSAKCDVHVVAAGTLGISGKTGEGIEVLLARIAERFAGQSTGGAVIVHARHRAAALRATGYLEGAAAGLAALAPAEMCADEIRLATRAVESLIGKVDTEELLGHIFGRFCIGK